VTIEAAYRALIDGPTGGVSATAAARRQVRLRVARDWLTDSERRSRYDALRTRTAARAVRTAIGDIPWPSADFRWSTTAEIDSEARALDPNASRATFERPSSRPRRKPTWLVGLGLVITVVVLGGIGVVAVAMRPASTDTAVAQPTPSTAPSPTVPATAIPSPEPTVAPTEPPASPGAVDTVALQQAAWDTIRALEVAAAARDVATAQTYLGDTAPGLRASGLWRASFPSGDMSEISITQESASYVAVIGTDRLTSTDGITWTFDYADRPLAAYRPPANEPVHDLWWEETDGRHHIYLRATLVTVSTSGVTANLVWTFDPSQPDDATYFRRAELLISSVTLDDAPTLVTGTPLPMIGVTRMTQTATFTGAGSLPSSLEIGVTITNPRAAGGSDRANGTTFKLGVR
jgi:hypothetical protein